MLINSSQSDLDIEKTESSNSPPDYSSYTMFWCDMMVLIIVSVFYFKASDEECAQFENRYWLLAGMIILASIMSLRLLSHCLIEILGHNGEFVMSVVNIVLISFSLAYFLTIIFLFFSKNHCREEAIHIWTGMLIMTIYAFVILIASAYIMTCAMLSVCLGL